MIVAAQGTPPLHRLGCTRASAETTTPPPTRSGPCTRGGGTHKPGATVQQQSDSSSSESDDPAQECGTQAIVLPMILRDLRGPMIRRLRSVRQDVWWVLRGRQGWTLVSGPCFRRRSTMPTPGQGSGPASTVPSLGCSSCVSRRSSDIAFLQEVPRTCGSAQ